jgi:hypothetical protein
MFNSQFALAHTRMQAGAVYLPTSKSCAVFSLALRLLLCVNAIMKTLANLARKVGYTVFIEPRHIRPEANSDTDRLRALYSYGQKKCTITVNILYAIRLHQ